MRVYWYWPFLRSEDISLAETVAGGPVKKLLVHTLDRPGVPTEASNPRVELRNDLPEVTDARPGSPGWAADRARIYLRRRNLRRAEAGSAHDLTHIWFLNRFTDTVDVPRLARAGRVVVNVHDIRPHTRRLPEAVSDRVLGRIYRSDALLVVHHADLADRLEAEFGVDRARIRVVPLMVRPRSPSSSHRHGDRVLFFGTFRHNKGIEVLLDAIERGDRQVEWEIIGRGESDLEAVVSAAARRFPNLSAVIGHASEQDKAAAFDRADVVVLPYTSFESQSGVLHDAYAHGVPVVVTDVGALGPSVREDNTGVVIAPGDAAALTEAVSGLLRDTGRRSDATTAIGEVARARSPEQIARLLHDLYAELI